MVFGGLVSAQDTEVTEEPSPEATEQVTPVPEATEEATPAPETTQEPEVTETPSSSGTTHTVVAGETLYRIAVNNGTTVAILAQLNNITNPSLIYTGQVLILPAGSDVVVPTATAEPEATEDPEATEEPASTPDPEATEEPDTDSSSSDDVTEGGSYVVQPGESLFSIATANNTTMAVLQQLNNIANVNLIFAGQRLILPGDDTDSESSDDSSDDSSEASSASADFGYGLQVYMDVSGTAATASQISQLGVDWVKIDVSWADIESLQGEFDYAALDATVQS